MAAPVSPLATLERCFALLTSGPGALTIDGSTVHPDLPPRPIPLDELRGLLHQLHPQARRSAVNLLLGQARAGNAACLVGLAGVLLPGLRHLAGQHTGTTKTATAEAHALTWFRATLAAHSTAADQHLQWLLDMSCTRPGAAKQAGR
jgi:hypothetical protein